MTDTEQAISSSNKEELGSRGEALSFRRQGGLRDPAFGDWGDILPKYPILGMFQLNFCLKTYETCSLLYVSVPARVAQWLERSVVRANKQAN